MPVTMDDFFSSKYLKAADLRGREAAVQIAGIQPIKMPDGKNKVILLFKDKQKGLVLNKTNANKIAAIYGQNLEEWTGKPVILYPDETNFQGEMVACVRVRVPQAPKAEPGDDSAPFENW